MVQQYHAGFERGCIVTFHSGLTDEERARVASHLTRYRFRWIDSVQVTKGRTGRIETIKLRMFRPAWEPEQGSAYGPIRPGAVYHTCQKFALEMTQAVMQALSIWPDEE